MIVLTLLNADYCCVNLMLTTSRRELADTFTVNASMTHSNECVTHSFIVTRVVLTLYNIDYDCVNAT